MTEEEYIIDPCRASSLPFWKTEEIKVPEHLLIVRDDLMPDTETEGEDEPYFRMIHDLDNVRRSPIPEGFVIAERGIPAFAEHITECYTDIGVKADDNGSRMYLDLEHYIPAPEPGTAIKEGDIYDAEHPRG